MKATAVIGANFGDEGKGAVTAHLVGAAPATSIVGRFNGGAQAGHTVVTPRRRHVFHHFGSGTLAGAASFLSRHFIVNPFLWEKERDELGHAELLVDPSAMLTTPFDMLLNQVAERKRGDGRHGSCGIGINETVTRCQSLMTSAGMTRDTDQLRDTLIRIRTHAWSRSDWLETRGLMSTRTATGCSTATWKRATASRATWHGQKNATCGASHT